MITLNDILDKPPIYLGNDVFFKKVKEAFSDKSLWTEFDLKAHLDKNNYGQYPYINKGLLLLRYIDIIQETKNGLIMPINFDNKDIICKLIKKLHHDDIFTEVFPVGAVSFDTTRKTICIQRNNMSFHYAPIANLIRDLSMCNIQESSFIILLPNDKELIDAFVLNSKERKKMISQQILQEILEMERIVGEEAEKYVLEFERKRLSDHDDLAGIQIISNYDVGAGYDIVSYENKDSTLIDRFIEVKSYVGSIPQFYWSRNEISVAKRFGKSYYIYLVNRSNINNPYYSPIIICNPSEAILKSNNWSKNADTLFIQMKAKCSLR